MGIHADDLRDQEEFMSMVRDLHQQGRCGQIIEFCPYCAYEEEQLSEAEEMFKPWIATGGNQNQRA